MLQKTQIEDLQFLRVELVRIENVPVVAVLGGHRLHLGDFFVDKGKWPRVNSDWFSYSEKLVNDD